MPLDYFYGEIQKELIVPNINEVSARLNMPFEQNYNLTSQCEQKLKNVIAPKYSGIRTDITLDGDKIDLGFGVFTSKDLAKNLTQCKEAFIFAVTIGNGVDRLLNKLRITSPAEHFITDGLASAYAEALADFVDKKIKGNTPCRPRFSVGYGDLPLEIQPQILESVNAARLLNITVSKSLLMSPSKSITAIMGIL